MLTTDNGYMAITVWDEFLLNARRFQFTLLKPVTVAKSSPEIFKAYFDSPIETHFEYEQVLPYKRDFVVTMEYLHYTDIAHVREAIAKSLLDPRLYKNDHIRDSFFIMMEDFDVQVKNNPGILSQPYVPEHPSGEGMESLATKLPGVLKVVRYPCKETDLCMLDGTESSIKNVIIHLNDSHKWTREQIADWLDTLDVDLRFNVNPS